MAQYIDKAKVIEKIKKQIDIDTKYGSNVYDCCNDILSFIDSLEVKEVDLEKEFYDFLDTLTGKDNGHLSENELFRIAEYFFELGIKKKNKEQ